MPYTVIGQQINIDSSAFTGRDYNYEDRYPNGLNLRPDSETHRFIQGRLIRYGLESARVAGQRHSAWNMIDDKLRAYIPVSQKERDVKKNDPRKPISIVFPYTYAILETLVSYLVAAFLQDPIFRYEGVSPEDVAGATLLEKVINLHCVRTKVALNLHTFFRDSCAYGFGAVTPVWAEHMGRDPKSPDKLTTIFEGNALSNIDPYNYLPDPSVPLHDVQRGEYAGWIDRTSYVDLLSDEQADTDMFNVRYLQHVNTKVTTLYNSGDSNRTGRGDQTFLRRSDSFISDPIDQLHLYVKLIPSKWKLGSSDVPEKWMFTMAGDSVIIRAKPMELYHNMFPIATCVPDFDGYSPISYSRLEILSGMQTVIDWLFNSHIANVRKAINDVLIVDPYLININDLSEPDAGGLVRLRRPAWGKGVKDAVMQLNIVDITRQNISDVAAIIQYMQVIGGTDNPLMGSLRQGGPERLTGAEFQGTARGAVNRLERIGKCIGMQGMQDIGYMFASHTQQFMQSDTWVRTVGEWPQAITDAFNIQGERALVRPQDLSVDYDVITRDGSIPGGNFSDAMPQLLKIIAENPALLPHFNVVNMVKYIALSTGAKNVDDFINKAPQVQAQTMPDAQVAAQVQAGNMVPLMGGANGLAA